MSDFSTPSSPDNLGPEASETPFVDETQELRELGGDMDDMGEDDDGEDLAETHAADYAAIPELDSYAGEDLDNREFSELDIGERMALEEQMRIRDRRHGRGGFDSDEDEGDEEFRAQRARRRRDRPEVEDRPEIIYETRDANINLADTRSMPIRQFLALDNVRREIGAQFSQFLTSFVDSSGNAVYGDAISTMCSNNESSLQVDYQQLCNFPGCAILAMYLVDAPLEMFKILSEATTQVVLRTFEQYKDIHQEIHVRITNLPMEDKLRELRESHLNTLVKVAGVVTRRTGVFPQLQYVQYDCSSCSHTLGPFMFENDGANKDMKLGACPNCQGRGTFNINNQMTVYKNFQQISLQESPGTVPAGRLPCQKKIILFQDLVDSCKPGDEVVVTAVYRNNFDIALNKQQGFPVFSTVLEANFVQRIDSVPTNLTAADKRLIREMGEDPAMGEKIMNSIAPSIHGHENIKAAIALALFGGEMKQAASKKHRVRGDINVLICGDPGTGKSQFLKYIEKTAPRCVYTTGQGASAVGLTASVQKDQVTREWVLEGGALVLADKGVCLIDEFDKMNDQDRTSIHEAMEQQSISISKAGIITSLQARCSVIAASNPRHSNYNPSCTFSQNVDLSEPILSRFDILCVVLDKSDREEDRRLAEFVVNSHDLNHPSHREALEAQAEENKRKLDGDQIPQEVLRKYIKYARAHIHPKLTNIDSAKLTKIYSVLRKEAMITNSIPITVRHLESMLRISEAHAKMHLREYVEDEDVNIAVRVMLNSFISTQKASVKNKLRKSLSHYLTYNKDFNELLLHMLHKKFQEEINYLRRRHGSVPSVITLEKETFQYEARQLNMRDLNSFYTSDHFINAGYVLDGSVIRSEV